MISKYIIMCGGDYTDNFDIPRPYMNIRGERLVDRTIRLLRENGVDDISISTNTIDFSGLGVDVLVNKKNTYVHETEEGCWLDAYFPIKENVVYVYGDVYFSEAAIKTIVDKANENNGKILLCGTGIAKNKQHMNWGEPFAFIVGDMETFRNGIETVRQMWKDGKVNRMPVTWELYRYLNGFDVNVQWINDNTYIVIDDETIDIDSMKSVERLNEGY